MPVGLNGRKLLAYKDEIYYHKKCLIKYAPRIVLKSVSLKMLKLRLLNNFSKPFLKEFIHEIASEIKWIPALIVCDASIIIRHDNSNNTVLEFDDTILKDFIGHGAWELSHKWSLCQGCGVVVKCYWRKIHWFSFEEPSLLKKNLEILIFNLFWMLFYF